MEEEEERSFEASAGGWWVGDTQRARLDAMNEVDSERTLSDIA